MTLSRGFLGRCAFRNPKKNFLTNQYLDIIIFSMSETYNNPNSNLDPQSPDDRLAKIGSEEYYDEKPNFSSSTIAYDGFEGCWPGDGSGMDDLADFNQMEGNDY